MPPLAISSNSEATADSDQEIRSHSSGEEGDNVKVEREDVVAEIGQRARPEVGDLMLCPGRMHPPSSLRFSASVNQVLPRI